MTLNTLDDNTTFWSPYYTALENALAGFGIISGCSISKGTGDWDIDVTSGTVFVTGTGEVSISSGTVTITDSSALTSGQSRITLITAQTGDALNDTDGSAATNPDAPDIPSDEVLLGFVVVADTDTTAADSDIIDIPALYNPPFTVIETQAPSGVSSADFTNLFGNHQAHIFFLHNVIPASDAQQLFLRTSTDAGQNWDSGTSDYSWASQRIDHSGTTASSNNASDSEIVLGAGSVGSAAGEAGVSGMVAVYGTGVAEETYVTWQIVLTNNNGVRQHEDGFGTRLASEDVTGVRFLFASGNIESGTIEHIGVN